MLVTEFTVEGTPRSVQAKGHSRRRWQTAVRTAASPPPGTPFPIVTSPVRVLLIYFFSHTDLDVDNIIKPILDAIIGVTYLDDSQVSDVTALKRDLANSYTLSWVSTPLMARLAGPSSDFVFVRVEHSDVKEIP